MNCPWVKKQITLYLYNELDDPDRIEVEQHLERCAACAAEVAQERRLHQVLSARPAPAVDPTTLAECRLRLSEAVEARPRSRFEWSWLWAALAGLQPSLQPTVALLLVAAGFAAGFLLSGPGRSLPPLLGPSNPAVDEFSVANISRIHSINTRPEGHLEIVFDTTRRRVLSGAPEDPQLRELLVYAARDYSNAGIRLDSIELLKDRTEDDAIRSALVSAVRTDRNPGVRLKALQALKGSETSDELKQALLEVVRGDDNPGVRIEAIEQLARFRDGSTVPLLQQLAAGDPNNYVRMRSASTLREMNASEIF